LAARAHLRDFVVSRLLFPSADPKASHRLSNDIFILADVDLRSSCPIQTGLLPAYLLSHGEVFLPAGPEGQLFSLRTSLTALFNRRPCFIRIPLALGSLVRFQFRRWANPTSVLRLELVKKVPKNFLISLIFKDA
jgi:hypothetical protein